MNELDTPNETQPNYAPMAASDISSDVFTIKPHPASYTVDALRGIKTCKRCAIFKELSDFSRNSHTPDGLQIWCRDCVNEYGRTKRRKEKRAARKIKICRTCSALKPLKQYHRNSATRDGYSYDCKSCRSIEYQKRAAKKRAAAVEMKNLASLVSRQTTTIPFPRKPPSLISRIISWFR